jgi:hypothetical protein
MDGARTVCGDAPPTLLLPKGDERSWPLRDCCWKPEAIFSRSSVCADHSSTLKFSGRSISVARGTIGTGPEGRFDLPRDERSDGEEATDDGCAGMLSGRGGAEEGGSSLVAGEPIVDSENDCERGRVVPGLYTRDFGSLLPLYRRSLPCPLLDRLEEKEVDGALWASYSELGPAWAVDMDPLEDVPHTLPSLDSANVAESGNGIPWCG